MLPILIEMIFRMTEKKKEMIRSQYQIKARKVKQNVNSMELNRNGGMSAIESLKQKIHTHTY